MGWNQLELRSRPPILAGIADGSYFYFVHSYYVAPRDRKIVAAEARYPEPFTAMIWRDNLYATQFHPEKSQADGLKLLKNFAEL
jgi:glutamine amidotransferase